MLAAREPLRKLKSAALLLWNRAVDPNHLRKATRHRLHRMSELAAIIKLRISDAFRVLYAHAERQRAAGVIHGFKLALNAAPRPQNADRVREHFVVFAADVTPLQPGLDGVFLCILFFLVQLCQIVLELLHTLRRH